MSDLQVEGAGLKKLIKLAKKNPLPFAFNPSTDIAECYLAMHRKKPAKILGKDAKAEGPGGKSAFGTIKVEKKLLILQCERVVPNLAKTLKKYLKLQKVVLNIEVRDENGNVVENDVEDGLPDDPELDGDDDDDGEIDKEALGKRLAELRKRIQALDPKQAEKFSGPYAKVVGLFKKDELELCERGADKIEAALPKPGAKPAPDTGLAKLVELYKQYLTQAAKIVDDGKRSNIEKALAQVATHLKAQKGPEASALLAKIRDALKKALANNIPEAPTAPAPADPKLIKLAEMLKNYRGQLSRVTDENARKAIEAELAVAAGHIRASDIEKATQSLIKARDALKEGIAAAKRAEDLAKEKQREEARPEAPDTEQLSEEDTKAFEAWSKVHKELTDKVDAALTKGLVVDVDGLRKEWKWAVGMAADKKYTEALANIPAVRKKLLAGTPEGKSAFNEDIPPDVKPFAESRVRWSFARSKMQSELDKLTSSIIDAVKDDEELHKEVAGSVGLLTKNLEKLDSRLEDKLDQIVNEKAGQKRDDFKVEAKKLIGEYRKELATDFFQEVDDNSGFGNVAIMATAQNALGAIENVLN